MRQSESYRTISAGAEVRGAAAGSMRVWTLGNREQDQASSPKTALYSHTAQNPRFLLLALPNSENAPSEAYTVRAGPRRAPSPRRVPRAKEQTQYRETRPRTCKSASERFVIRSSPRPHPFRRFLSICARDTLSQGLLLFQETGQTFVHSTLFLHHRATHLALTLWNLFREPCHHR